MDSSLVWNDTPIHKRANGWINATEMCKANGKVWYAFFRSDRCQSYVKALAQLRKIYAVDLYETTEGNSGETWIDPDLATELARWISPEFSVFVNQSFRKNYEEQQRSIKQSDDWSWRLDICERVGIKFDARDKLLIKDILINQKLIAPSGGVSIPDVGISYAINEVFDGLVLPLDQLKKIGIKLKKIFVEERGHQPIKHDQYVDGATRSVNTYPRDWIIGTLPVVAKAYPELFKV